jgi:hypothetical protein
MNAVRSLFNLLITTAFALVMCTATYWIGVGPIKGLFFEGNTPPGIHVTALLTGRAHRF